MGLYALILLALNFWNQKESFLSKKKKKERKKKKKVGSGKFSPDFQDYCLQIEFEDPI